MFANPRTFSMICAHPICSLRNGHSLLVVRCTSRTAHCANFDFGSHGGSMNCLSRIPTHWYAFLNWKWCLKVRITFFKYMFHFIFLGDPGGGYIPRRRALDAERCKYHENSLCARVKGPCVFFQIFFQKKNDWERFESHRIELVCKAEPIRNSIREDTISSDFPSVARRVSGIFDLR